MQQHVLQENIQEAKEMITIIEKVDLPTEGDDWEQRNSNTNCGESVEEIIEMLQ